MNPGSQFVKPEDIIQILQNLACLLRVTNCLKCLKLFYLLWNIFKFSYVSLNIILEAAGKYLASGTLSSCSARASLPQNLETGPVGQQRRSRKLILNSCAGPLRYRPQPMGGTELGLPPAMPQRPEPPGRQPTGWQWMWQLRGWTLSPPYLHSHLLQKVLPGK